LGFIITGFATSGSVEESYSFYYESSPSAVETLSLSADIGAIDIKYNTSATPYLAKVDVDLKVSGLFVAGRKYTAFFTPYTGWWQNSTPPTSFDMKILPGAWFDPSHWFKSYNVDIMVTLRTDVVYNIDVTAGTGSLKLTTSDDVILDGVSMKSGTGNVELDLSNNTQILTELALETGTGNVNMFSEGTNFTHGVFAETGTGTLDINFTDCILGGDIDASTGTGNVNLKTYNMEYSVTSYWLLETGTGKITLVITQDAGMTSNVTGDIKTGTGNIDITYIDTISTVGARFYGATGTGSFNRINTQGFTQTSSNPFDSDDFLTSTTNYDFNLDTGTGNIFVDGSSV